MRRPFQVMVLGTGSHVGKSLVAAGLCRLLADRGYRVAPFKAQNMALNSAVSADGGEVGRAQWLQAVAARTPCVADMNPVLLKPQGAGRSQLVVLGRARATLTTRAYFRRWPAVAACARAAWGRLAGRHDALVLEGAGSPAEVNLRHRDLANLETARFSRAPFVLVVDIERGGAFAAVVGTLGLLPPWLRRRCLGVVFNKFRGDASLMDPGLGWLRRRGILSLGVIPWCEGLQLEQEDSLGIPSSNASIKPGKDLLIDVISDGLLANYNDLLPLDGLPGVCLRWVRAGQERGPADLVVLPGSKDTLTDLRRLKSSGEAGRLLAWGKRGTWILGICGGFQMMGRTVDDPEGVDSGSGRASSGTSEEGLGLLPVATRMAPGKILARRRLEAKTSLGLLTLEGYEIHHGRTKAVAGPPARLEAGTWARPLLLSAGRGRVWGTYLHGLLDLPGFRDALLRGLARDRGKPWRGPAGVSQGSLREASLDRWARHLERHMDLSFLPAAR